MERKFSVDIVATPRIDLCGAVTQDLQYQAANGRFPPPQRSRLAQEQEKINKYLQYVNETFIIKGFSKTAKVDSLIPAATAKNGAAVSAGQEGILLAQLGLTLAFSAHVQCGFSLCGSASQEDAEIPAVLTLTTLENGSPLAVWTQTLTPGDFSFGAPLLLPDRVKGQYVLGLRASVDGGALALAKGSAYLHATVLYT